MTAPLDPTPISFRPLTTDDLPQLRHWLTTPHVARWWYETAPITLEWVIAKYAPRIAGREPTDCFIILYAGRPIGFIQTYRLADYPAYNQAVAVAEEAAGVDLFIGEPDVVHRGLGAPILTRFLGEIVFARSPVVSCMIGPEPKNAAAIRAYEKAGFRYLKTIHLPDEPAPEYLMRLGRDEWPVASGQWPVASGQESGTRDQGSGWSSSIASTLAQVVHRLAATAYWGPPWT